MSNRMLEIKNIFIKVCLVALAAVFLRTSANAQEGAKDRTNQKMKSSAVKAQPAVKKTETNATTVAHKSKASASKAKKSKAKKVDERTQFSDEVREREADAREEQQRQSGTLRAEKAKRESQQSAQAGGKTLEHKGVTMNHKAKIENAAATEERTPRVQPPHVVKKDSLKN